MDALNLSDSDSDALFDTPAAKVNRKKTQQAGADAGEGAAGGKARAKESHYTTEEAREVALRRELESIRNVNKVIEGVVESLQKAKDNMEVCIPVEGELLVLMTTRRSLKQCKTPPPSSRHGHASYRKPNTISA
jgi:hypothetical protein